MNSSWSSACFSCFCCQAGDVLAPACAAVAAAVVAAMTWLETAV